MLETFEIESYFYEEFHQNILQKYQKNQVLSIVKYDKDFKLFFEKSDT
jgi:hypothetical protein